MDIFLCIDVYVYHGINALIINKIYSIAENTKNDDCQLQDIEQYDSFNQS